MHCFVATLKVDPHFLLYNEIIQTIFVVFLLKTCRACTDMSSYENDAIKFSKTAKNTNNTCTIVPGIFLQTSLPLTTRNMNAKIAV